MVGERQYPWEEHYIAAILETDNAKLAERVGAAHAAIASRRNELRMDHGGTPEEQHALSDAVSSLAVLKNERSDEPSGGNPKQITDGGDQPAGRPFLHHCRNPRR